MLQRLILHFCLFVLVSPILSQNVTPQTFWPAALPLAVRTPYFNAWQPTTNGTTTLDTWPEFWNFTNGPLGWVGHIRIDGDTYRWLGGDPGVALATLTNVQVTPTRTIYYITAGSMDLSITFLSPIEPSDCLRQSIPFSYISLEASSNDGEPHQVEVYSDISADWLSGNLSALVEWSTTTSQQSLYHEASLQSPAPFVEINGQAEDGSVFYAMSEVSDIMYQTGRDQTVRGIFESNGSLTDTQDTSFRAINDNPPVFAIAVNLGLITSTVNPVVWALGYVRNPVIQYTTPTGEPQLRYPYWATQYSSVSDVIDEVLRDFTAALSRAIDLDNRVMAATSNISTKYTDIVSLGARQAFAGMDITVSNGTDGALNMSDVKIFMKNIGTDRRVNPVEVMFAVGHQPYSMRIRT